MGISVRTGMKTSMKTTAVLSFALLALAACSIPERTDYKTDPSTSSKGRPLDMPPDLVLPKGETKYVVPEGGVETSATYSDYAKSGAGQNESCICKDGATVTPAAGQSSGQPNMPPVAVARPAMQLQERAGGSKAIIIAEPFDRCWLRVSQALDQAGIEVEDKDRSKGLFYLKNDHNQLSVQDKGTSCEVTTSNGQTLDSLYKALNK